MNKDEYNFSSGLPGLDEILSGIWAGDNVVWQADDIEAYKPFVEHFYNFAQKADKKIIYFRFAKHSRVLSQKLKAKEIVLDPQKGFEPFISEIFHIIEQYGKGICYVFDCLSDLAADWYSHRMLANFFLLTCPYLNKYDTVAYFLLLRKKHTPLAVNTIHSTAQVILNIYNKNKKVYVHPAKVAERYSPTMYMPHYWESDKFTPVLKSIVLSELFSETSQEWIDLNIKNNELWANTFLNALHIQRKYEEEFKPFYLYDKQIKQIIRMILTRDEKLYNLCEKYLDLEDLIAIGKRMIGTGLIGGKSVGMLLSRAILEKHSKKWKRLLETHDSFFIGSDIFYSYIIHNKCWWDRYKLKKSKNILENAEKIKKKILKGTFPDDIIEQFKELLNYFGQSPIIIRSSSLLEDAYGNAFSGKYESVFCTNQGTPQERLSNLMDAVRTVYASTMNRDAVSYRIQRGLFYQDEQMALLIQRVSGSFYNNLYYPHIAGVGYSYNPFVWNTKIDPQKGLLRIVFGLGTRAVDRHDDDYTRIIALNEPLLRPEVTYDEVKKYSQKNIDVLDLSEQKLCSKKFEHVAETLNDIPIHLVASKDTEMERRAKEMNVKNYFPWILSFKHLITQSNFMKEMEEMLSIIQNAYNYPVDIEFSANFLTENDYRINLLQCRPFQVEGKLKDVTLPKETDPEKILLRSKGPIIGQNTISEIDTLIYIRPDEYSKLPMSKRYAVARLVGELANGKKSDAHIMVMGPGRWGTKMPSLGIPVSFSEIQNVTAICEIVKMHKGLIPDISLGTHFFNDLVEMNILYITIAPDKNKTCYNEDLILSFPNSIDQLLPDYTEWSTVIHIIDIGDNNSKKIKLYTNSLKQDCILRVE